MNKFPTLATLALFVIHLSTAETAETLTRKIEQIEEQAFVEEKAARTVEENGLVPVWDRLNAASPVDRFDVLTSSGIESVTLGRESGRVTYDHGIEEVKYSEGGKQLDVEAWRGLVQDFKSQGYEITHSDWHQERYETDAAGNPVTDTRFTIQGRRNAGKDRLEIKATVRVTWKKDGDRFLPARVEVIDGKVRQRRADPAFVQKLRGYLGSPDKPEHFSASREEGCFVVHDLNDDQLPEIIFATRDQILWNRGNWKFDAGKIFTDDSRLPNSRIGMLADVNSDGIPDWVCENGPSLEYHVGLEKPTPEGAFEAEAIPIPITSCEIKNISAITAGDVNGDGHLDLFVAQYRQPYESMPEKFWDANDGYGNTLLINDGKGNFTDQTEAAGLGEKQFRRTYSASFLDVNDDAHPDLVVVSDFYGTDMYLGDGTGQFADATATLIDEPHTFGMSHTVADYDHNGQFDLFVTGMSSTTSRRLERMKAFPEGFEEANRMRKVMGYGNRMYLGKPNGGFAEPEFKDAVARTGWSWGSTSFDFDNDGFEDIYVGNGHITGESTRDYCTSFWCRDIYLLPGLDKPQLQSYIASIPDREIMSWDGFQVNSLLVNQGGKGFQDLGYMMDLGFNYDTRQVVAADLDLDGRMDLIVARQPEYGKTDEDTRPSSVMLYQNVLDAAAKRDWIGVSLTGKPGVSPLGAVVELDTANGIRHSAVLSGDSYRCQHPAQKHFGIEPGNTVKSLTVKWPDGSKTVKQEPELEKYHPMAPPAP